MKGSYTKLSFRLERDKDGFPPVEWEDLWAIDLGSNRYQVANIPFYARGVSFDDIVSAKQLEGRLVFDSLIEAKGNSTVHVVVFDKSLTQEIRNKLSALSCGTELSNIEGYFSVDVPAGVNYKNVLDVLGSYTASGKLDYQESTLRHPD